MRLAARKQWSFGTLVLLLSITAFFCAYLFHQWSARVGHDQMSYLYEAQRFLGGDEIYGPHLQETNPPVIIWFSSIPVLLADSFDHPSPLVFRGIVATMALFSILWSTAILFRTRRALAENLFAVGLVGLSLVIFLFACGSYDFGQREHLFLIFVLPYAFICTAPESSSLSRTERAAAGICAGFAVWFKPHDVLVILVLELYRALRGRRLRQVATPEMAFFLSTTTLLFALVMIVTPLYRTVMLPLLNETYWGMGTETTGGMVKHSHVFVFIPVIVAWFVLRRRLTDPQTSIGLMLAGLAAWGAFVIQHTSWNYHRYPFHILLLLGVCYFAIDLLLPVFKRISQARQPVALALLALFLVALSGRLNARIPVEVVDQTDPVLSKLPPSTSVYVFSTGVPPLASAYYYNLNWTSRFVHLWMIPAIIQNEVGPKSPHAPFKQLPPGEVMRLAKLQRDAVAEDIGRECPSIVMIEHCQDEWGCTGLENLKVDLLAWFMRSPSFAEQWSHYRRESISLWHFDVYKRTE